MWLTQVAERNRRLFGDRVAVVDDARSITYAELLDRSARLAQGLRSQGVRRGDRVALLSLNRSEVIESYFALARLGCGAVPLNHGLVAEEARYVLEQNDVAGVLGERQLIDSARAADGLRFAIDFDDPEYERLATGELGAPLAVPALDDVAAILSTSATTGKPKGVVYDHASLMSSSLSWLATSPVYDDTVLISATPLFHSTVTIVFAYLAGGARLVLMRRFSPQRVLSLIESERATDMYLVPSMIDYVLRSRGVGDADVSSLRQILHGASPMSAALRRQATETLGCVLRDCYGQAEAGGAITLGDARPDRPGVRERIEADPATCGRPLLGYEVVAMDDDGVRLPDGEIGELCVRSRSLMGGYWDNPGASASVLRDGWLRTGDLGRVDAESFVYVMDRRVDMIIRGGQNVYPVEIEQVLTQHPGVAEAAVVGAPDDTLQEVPFAFVVADPDQPATVEDLTAHAVAKLATYKRPTGIVFTDELPRNASGKVLKKELRARIPAQEAVR